MSRRQGFNATLHASIASVLTGFAALILSLHNTHCRPLFNPYPSPSSPPLLSPNWEGAGIM
jgi:hypothetical protein